MNKYILTFACFFTILIAACKKDNLQTNPEQEQPTLERFSAAYLSLGLDTAKICRVVLPSTEKLSDTTTTRDKLWKGKTTITVSFLGGSSTLQTKVMSYATQWSETTGIKFQTTTGTGDIRVSFDGDSGSWSYIGTDAIKVNANQPTMNYGWLTEQSSDAEISKIVLHEFGHALGLIHEHQRPNSEVNWNTSAVYIYYEGYPNYWTKEQVDAYVISPNGSSQLIYNADDSSTIMNFPISNALSSTSISTKNTITLSEGDKGLISFVYPTLTGIKKLNFRK